MMKIKNYSRLVTIMDKVLRLIFCLSIILVLFLDWFPGMIGPHPMDSPVTGWMTILLSPFVVPLLFSASSHIGLAELLLAGLILMLWSVPMLSLLNLLLSIRRFYVILWLHRILLAMSLGIFGVQTAVIAAGITLERSGRGGPLLGIWVYTGLLCMLAAYEVIFYITNPKRAI
jgi:hypothetical protein